MVQVKKDLVLVLKLIEDVLVFITTVLTLIDKDRLRLLLVFLLEHPDHVLRLQVLCAFQQVLADREILVADSNHICCDRLSLIVFLGLQIVGFGVTAH